MSSSLRSVAVLLLVLAFASPCFAQPNTNPLPEPVPMGIPYYILPGNQYAPAFAFPSPYPWGATVPIYGRYAWDYTGQFTGYVTYPYSYYYPTFYTYYSPTAGYVWMGGYRR